MSIINNGLLLASGADAATGYQISRSIRLNSADSAYFSRTPGSAGNRKTYTFSCWLKRSKLGTLQYVIQAYGGGTYRASLFFDTDDTLYFALGNTSPAIRTNAVFRDVSAWYHIVLAIDTTQSTQSAGMKLYVNGTQQTVTNSGTYTQNDEGWINSTSAHQISGTSGYYLDGYLADIYFLDGTATTPSTFAETDAVTGQWVPKTPTSISYGTNGFRLTFSDNSGTTSTTLGKDAAGSNNWTPNNFSVASGSGNDSLVDSPTSYGTPDTGVGGEIRGNYATLNPLSTVSDTLSNGNLDWVCGIAASRITKNTIAISTGKWYAEFLYTGSTTNGTVVGICEVSATGNSGLPTTGYMYYQNGNKYIDSTGSAYGSSWANGDLIGIALNLDSNQVTFYKNNTSQGAISITSGLTWVFCCIGSSTNDKATWNFGARAFSYTAPSGFKALVDTNLTAPTIAKPADYFDVKTYSGNGSTQTISGLGFSPDLVWIKIRSAAYSHCLTDTVRGATKEINSNLTNAESTDANGLTAFNSDGFSLGSSTVYNGSSNTFVAWAWDAASSNSTNTSGTITSTVRANATAGFSICTFTTQASGSGQTVGHGLGVAPSLIIQKIRNVGGSSWFVYHTSLGAGNYILFDTSASVASSAAWNSTSPTSSVWSLGSTWAGSYSAVAYCWTPVTGYSSFGSYVGTGTGDGPFVYTGFRPRWIMVKSSDWAGGNWTIIDAARDTYNVTTKALLAENSAAEQNYSQGVFDILSNGFKVKYQFDSTNRASTTFVYAAVAESPFQYARAR